MAVALQTDDAVCLRCWDWSETSQTAVFFARGLGLVRCVAKGAKRENARFSGGIQALTRGEMIVSMRKVERDPQSLATLASWDLTEVFPAARNHLSAFYAGHAMMDVVQHALTDGDPHPALFDALVGCTRMLSGEAATNDRAVLLLSWSALSETGHAPELWRDVRSGEDLTGSGARTFAFVARLGGVTRDEQTGTIGPAWRVRGETVRVLRDAARGGVAPGTDGASVVRAASLLLMYFREVFSCDPAGVGAWLERAR